MSSANGWLGGPILWLRGCVMAEKFSGDVEVLHPTSGERMIKLSGESAAIYLGAQGQDGDLIVYDAEGYAMLEVDGKTGQVQIGGQRRAGKLIVCKDDGVRVMTVTANSLAGHGIVHIGNRSDFETGPCTGVLFVYDQKGHTGIEMVPGHIRLGTPQAEDSWDDYAGEIKMLDRLGRLVILLEAETGTLHVGSTGSDDRGHRGRIKVYDNQGRTSMDMDGRYAVLHIGCPDGDNEGDIRLYDNEGRTVFNVDGEHANVYVGAANNEGHLKVRAKDGDTCIHLNGDSGLVELFGADCAEDFEVVDIEVDPGTVMVIGDDGRLCVSSAAYDRCVAGVVSGAGDLRPGIVLGREGGCKRRVPIALVGRAYCKVDATRRPVRMGDLLTTSDVAGYAMAVEDRERAFGSVIGKALRPLEQGRGLIPILIAMQ